MLNVTDRWTDRQALRGGMITTVFIKLSEWMESGSEHSELS